MKITETEEFKRWFSRFKPEDKPTALALVETLRIVSSNTFDKELEQNVLQVANATETPIAMYVARAMRDEESYFVAYTENLEVLRRGEKEVGSESKLAYKVTQLNRSDKCKFLHHPTLKETRLAGCRHFVILDDLAGSGKRLVEFVDSWMRSKIMRGWWSYGRITIHVVAYAVSQMAEKAVRDRLFSSRTKRDPSKLRFIYTRRPTGSQDLLDPGLYAKVENLCQEYGINTGINAFSLLGYGGVMGNLIFYHCCPDNAPGILWETCGGWPAIFPDRSVPHALKIGEEHLGRLHEPANLFNVLDAKKVGEGLLFHRLSPLGQRVLLLLAALRAKAGKHEERLLEVTGFTRSEYDEVAYFAERNGLIDETSLLTELGRRELRHAEKAGTMPLEPPPLSNKGYFPRTLRVARD